MRVAESIRCSATYLSARAARRSYARRLSVRRHRPAGLIEPDEWLPYVFDGEATAGARPKLSPERLRAQSLVLRRKAALVRSIVSSAASIRSSRGGGPDEGEVKASARSRSRERWRPRNEAAAAVLRRIRSPSAAARVAGFEQAVHLYPSSTSSDLRPYDSPWRACSQPLPAAGRRGRQATLDVLARNGLADARCAIAEVVAGVRELHDLTSRSLQGRGCSPRPAQGRPQRPPACRQRTQVQAVSRRTRAVSSRPRRCAGTS